MANDSSIPAIASKSPVLVDSSCCCGCRTARAVSGSLSCTKHANLFPGVSIALDYTVPIHIAIRSISFLCSRVQQYVSLIPALQVERHLQCWLGQGHPYETHVVGCPEI